MSQQKFRIPVINHGGFDDPNVVTNIQLPAGVQMTWNSLSLPLSGSVLVWAEPFKSAEVKYIEIALEVPCGFSGVLVVSSRGSLPESSLSNNDANLPINGDPCQDLNGPAKSKCKDHSYTGFDKVNMPCDGYVGTDGNVRDCPPNDCDVIYRLVAGSLDNIIPESFYLNKTTGYYYFEPENHHIDSSFEFDVLGVNCCSECVGGATQMGPWGPYSVTHKHKVELTLCGDEVKNECCGDNKTITDPNLLKFADECHDGDHCYNVRVSEVVDKVADYGFCQNYDEENPCDWNLLKKKDTACETCWEVNCQDVKKCLTIGVKATASDTSEVSVGCEDVIGSVASGDEIEGDWIPVYRKISEVGGFFLLTATGEFLLKWKDCETPCAELEYGIYYNNQELVTATHRVCHGCANPCYEEYGTMMDCVTKITTTVPCMVDECHGCWEGQTKIMGKDGETVCQECTGGTPIIDEEVAAQVCPNRFYIDECGHKIQGTLVVTDWFPLPEQVCEGEPFIQKSYCCPGVERTHDDQGALLVGTLPVGNCMRCKNGILYQNDCQYYCDPETGECVECLQDCNCTSTGLGTKCVEGKCVSPCNPLECMTCSDTGECISYCDPCEACDGQGNCVYQCNSANCEICVGGHCVSACATNETCDGNGVCVCTPVDTCASRGWTCGTFVDDCGVIQNCGSCAGCCDCIGGQCQSNNNNCAVDESCINCLCQQCTPTDTCASRGWICGTFVDDCGATIDCGACTGCQVCNNGACEDDDSLCPSPQTCLNGTCVDCVPTDTCASRGWTCGSFTDDCGNVVDCGSCSGCCTCNNGACEDDDTNCTSPETCQNCECSSCTPLTCLPAWCGVRPDGCGSTIDCGVAGNCETCINGIRTSCADQGLVCNGSGQCVECVLNTDCAACENCVSASCVYQCIDTSECHEICNGSSCVMDGCCIKKSNDTICGGETYELVLQNGTFDEVDWTGNADVSILDSGNTVIWNQSGVASGTVSLTTSLVGGTAPLPIPGATTNATQTYTLRIDAGGQVCTYSFDITVLADCQNGAAFSGCTRSIQVIGVSGGSGVFGSLSEACKIQLLGSSCNQNDLPCYPGGVYPWAAGIPYSEISGATVTLQQTVVDDGSGTCCPSTWDTCTWALNSGCASCNIYSPSCPDGNATFTMSISPGTFGPSFYPGQTNLEIRVGTIYDGSCTTTSPRDIHRFWCIDNSL